MVAARRLSWSRPRRHWWTETSSGADLRHRQRPSPPSLMHASTKKATMSGWMTKVASGDPPSFLVVVVAVVVLA